MLELTLSPVYWVEHPEMTVTVHSLGRRARWDIHLGVEVVRA
jgi:hypothetical protein